MINKNYENEILQWRQKKYDSLVRENGWLALAGLFWLNKGRNLMGSNPMCEVILPEYAPTFLGIVELSEKAVRFQVAEGVRVQINGRLAAKAVLRSSQEAKPSFITWDDLRMVLHEHAGKYAMRIWDNKREQRFSLPPLKWFPINKELCTQARYKPYPEPRAMPHEDTYGDTVEGRVDGYVEFKYKDDKYRLDVSETKNHRLFIKFRDETSSKETYPTGRYCYSSPLNDDGKVIVDFNYSYSPPCAFTEYATCLFAPRQNHLPFRVEAGEIYRG